MINGITTQELELIISKEHPFWNSDSIHKQAEEYLISLDEKLSETLIELVKNGSCSNFEHGEFSLYSIRAFRKNCGYFEAIVLMDAYIKDPSYGKALILRR